MSVERIFILIILIILFMPFAYAQSLLISGEAYKDGRIDIFEMYLAESPPSTFSTYENIWNFEIMDSNGSISSRLAFSPTFRIIEEYETSVNLLEKESSKFKLYIPLPKDAKSLRVRHNDLLVFHVDFVTDYCMGPRICIDCHRFLDLKCESSSEIIIENNEGKKNDSETGLIILAIFLLFITLTIFLLALKKRKQAW